MVCQLLTQDSRSLACEHLLSCPCDCHVNKSSWACWRMRQHLEATKTHSCRHRGEPSQDPLRLVQVSRTSKVAHRLRSQIYGCCFQPGVVCYAATAHWYTIYNQVWSHCERASLVAQMVKNLLIMQETWVWSLGHITPVKNIKLFTGSLLPSEKNSISLSRIGGSCLLDFISLCSPST